MTTGPLRVTPRLDAKPWGGSRLRGMGFAWDGSEPLGEVVMTATAGRVAGGPHDGRSLGELIAADPIGMIGRRGLAATGGRALFPLLVKLIDAAEPLSIQVHPDDRRGAVVGSLGKTEAWHVLAAEPRATFYAGLVDGVGLDELGRAVGTGPGAVAGLVRQVPAVVGETILFPAGTLHALGPGVMVYELQQPSEITYRLDDWGRLGADGRPRAMHVAEALEAIDPTLRPKVIPPVLLHGAAIRRELLVACRYFALDRFEIGERESVTLRAVDSCQAITVVSGEVRMRPLDAGKMTLTGRAGETVVVPAAVATVEVGADEDAVVLRAWVPDLATDIVRPGLAAGVELRALLGLSAPLGDVAAAAERVGGVSPGR